jgi:hypothetical protein
LVQPLVQPLARHLYRSPLLAAGSAAANFRRSSAIVPINHISGFEFDMPRGEIGSMSIDNLVVTEIPEPDTGFLLSFSAVVIFRCATRRRDPMLPK